MEPLNPINGQEITNNQKKSKVTSSSMQEDYFGVFTEDTEKAADSKSMYDKAQTEKINSIMSQAETMTEKNIVKDFSGELKKLGGNLKDADLDGDEKISQEELNEYNAGKAAFEQTKKEIEEFKKLSRKEKKEIIAKYPKETKKQLRRDRLLEVFSGIGLTGIGLSTLAYNPPLGAAVLGLAGLMVYTCERKIRNRHENEIVRKNLDQYIGKNAYVDAHLKDLKLRDDTYNPSDTSNPYAKYTSKNKHNK